MYSQHSFENDFERFIAGFATDTLPKSERSEVGCELVFGDASVGREHRRASDAQFSQVLTCTSSSTYLPSPWTTYSRLNTSLSSSGS